MTSTNDLLSPSVRRMYDAFNRVALNGTVSFATDRLALAAFLDALVEQFGAEYDEVGVDHAVPSADIYAIADELRGKA